MKKSKLVKTPLDDLTYQVNGLAIKVKHELKSGHREETYQRLLVERLREAGFQVEAEKQVEVYVNDALVGYMFIDIWVDQSVVVECKAYDHPLTNLDVGQVITYLAATGSPVGIIYNFGRRQLEWKRILPPRNVQEWHQHLYRCIWTPPGHSQPSAASLSSATPIRFSVTSPAAAESARSSVVDPATSQSASVHLPAGSPEAQSAPVRLSVVKSVDDTSAYSSAGVSIDAGNRAVDLMRADVRSTYNASVLAGIGAFGGLFDAAALKQMRQPVLVASTDGVGTKVKLAAQAGRYESIGHDIANHCIGDILVQGARPLFFMDYLASSRLRPEQMAEVVRGVAAACRAAGCVLLGGETAEMPGVYHEGEFDVAGTIVGVVEREAVLPRTDIQAGDLLVGMRSSGPHTNGYSLIRKVFADVPLDHVFPELGRPLADVLLAPHRSYLPVLAPLLDTPAAPKALAHITGGGLSENIPRVLPDGLGAVVRTGAWPVPPLFQLIQQRGEIANDEMYRVFNMGIGMVAVVGPASVAAFQSAVGEETYVIGELVAGERLVFYR